MSARPPLGLARLEDRLAPADVRLDPTFGFAGAAQFSAPPGVSTSPFFTVAAGVATAPDGGTATLYKFHFSWFVERRTADGQLDPGFGTGGRVTLFDDPAEQEFNSLTNADRANYVGLGFAPDGGLLVAGTRTEPTLPGLLGDSRLDIVRLTPTGQVDPAFAANAAAATAGGYGPGAAVQPAARGLVVAADGSLTIGGTGRGQKVFSVLFTSDGPTRAGVLRLRPDGTADPAFGTNGAAAFGPEAGFDPGTTDDKVALAVTGLAVDPLGRPALSGFTLPSNSPLVTTTAVSRAYQARLTAAGRLDPTFAGDGVAEPLGNLPSGSTTGLAATPDGGLLVGLNLPADGVFEGRLVRLTPAGALDAAFGDAGTARLPGRTLAAFAVGPDGTAAAVDTIGVTRTPGGGTVISAPTTVFTVSPAGQVRELSELAGRPPADQRGQSIAVDAGGRVTVGGIYTNDGRFDIRVARLIDRLPARLDPGFGTGGAFAPLTGRSVAVPRVLALPDGRTLALGSVDEGWFVERLTPAGRPDTTYGEGSRVRLPGHPSASIGETVRYLGLAAAPDGGVYVVGTATSTARLAIVVARRAVLLRITPDGRLDAGFNTNARAAVAGGFGPGADRFPTGTAAAVAPDGGVFLAGTGEADNGLSIPSFLPRGGVLRLNPDGTRDTAFGTGGAFTLGPDDILGPPPDTDPSNSGTVFDVLSIDGLGVDASGRPTLIGDTGRSGAGVVPSTRLFVARLTTAGELDPAFGDGGLFLPTTGDLTQPVGLTALPAGGWLVGWNESVDSIYQGRLARVTADGQFDPGYGDGGLARLPGRTLAAFAVGADGSAAAVDTGRFRRSDNNNDFGNPAGVYRVSADGRVELLGGLTVPTDTDPPTASAVAVDPAGRITATVGDRVIRPLDRLPAADPRPVDFPEPVSPAPPVSPATADRTLLVGGVGGVIQVFTITTASELTPADPVTPFPGFAGPVRGTAADLTGTGTTDAVYAVGPGGGSRVRVVFGDGRAAVEWAAFEGGFSGGVFVTTGDVTGDGVPDVVVTPDVGGGPVVAVFDGVALRSGRVSEATRLFGPGDPATFRGGARAAVGDANGDGRADLVVTLGPGGGPVTAVFDGQSLLTGPRRLRAEFLVFEAGLRTGLTAAVADLDGDGKAELAFSTGPGGAPRVRVFSGDATRADFFAGDAASRGGATVAVRVGRLLVGGGGRVRAYTGAELAAVGDQPADADPFGGVYVG